MNHCPFMYLLLSAITANKLEYRVNNMVYVYDR